MKHIALKIFALLAFASLSINAQWSQGLTAKVPFDFIVGQKNFPAGEYGITIRPETGLALVQSLDHTTSGFAHAT
jgi:hypothetical protein